MSRPTWPARIREEVNARQGGVCIAILLGERGPCRNSYRNVIAILSRDREIDHIREEPGGERRTDTAHGVAACPYHHRGGWATSHRPEIRAYLAEHHPDEWREWIARRSPDRVGSRSR